MNRKKRKSKNDLIIDLTSLLDVIFIILLALMVGQKEASEQEQHDLDALQAAAAVQIAQAKNAQQLYEDMLDTQNNLSKYVYAVSITVPYDPDNKGEIHIREINLLIEGCEPQTFTLKGKETADTLAAFKESLAASIANHADCPVILSLNEDDKKILYRDEKAVSGILSELSAEYDNVYIKGNLSEVVP